MLGLYEFLSIGVAGMVLERLIHFGNQAWRSHAETALKRDMVARGYSAQEIVEVVAARHSASSSPLSTVPPAKPIQQPASTPA